MFFRDCTFGTHDDQSRSHRLLLNKNRRYCFSVDNIPTTEVGAHRGQYDKGGVPYITHPLHLADQMQTEDECVVALLHDVMEDTGFTEKDLKQWGFSDRQIAALTLLRYDESVPYLDYIQKIRMDPIARAVKIADLNHNSELTRLFGCFRVIVLRYSASVSSFAERFER